MAAILNFSNFSQKLQNIKMLISRKPGLGSSTWSQVQVQLLCQVASTSTSTDLKSQVQVQVL